MAKCKRVKLIFLCYAGNRKCMQVRLKVWGGGEVPDGLSLLIVGVAVFVHPGTEVDK